MLMKNLRPIYKTSIILLIILCSSNLVEAQNKVLTKVNNGVSWVTPSLSIKGGGGTTVSGTYPNYTISSSSGGSYTAGSGISLANNRVTNTAPDRTLILRGSGGTSISGAYPNFTVTSSSGVSYSAGTGISISGNTVTNTAPDRTISISGSGQATVTGTYPNFNIYTPTSTNHGYSAGLGISIIGSTVNNTAPDKIVKIAEGSGVTVTGTYPNFSIKTAKPVATALTLPVTNYTPTSTSGAYSLGNNHHVIFANTANANANFTLPAPSSMKGKRYTFIKTSTNNSLIFSRGINTAPTASLSKTNYSGTNIKVTIVSTGTNWWEIEN